MTTARPTVSAVALRLRSILGSSQFTTEGARRAALRRAVHETAAGLKQEEITGLIDELRGRFPDRMFEAADKADALEKRAARLEGELTHLRQEHEKLLRRASTQETALNKLVQMTKSSHTSAERVDPDALTPLLEAVALLLCFAEDQESTAGTVEETLSYRRSGPAATPQPLPELFARLGRGEATSSADLAEIDRRLRRLRLLPGALLAGAQQSWKAGTREVLEHLDPKAAEAVVPTKVPGLREAALIKEVRHRFDEFWGQFEKNIVHYYRGKLERIYSEKMEDRT
jgi:hypothetical protein